MTLQMEPPPPPPQRRAAMTSCDLHPGETFTGFCAACLRERLAGLEASASSASGAAPGRKSTSAIKSFFSKPFAASSSAAALPPPDLRRCKSFSCGRAADALAAAVAAAAADGEEPYRRSCDVRGRSTLWSLFHQDDRERVRDGTAFGAFPASSSAAAAATTAALAGDLPEVTREEEQLEDEITPVDPVLVVASSGEIEVEPEAPEAAVVPELKPMKDHIYLESSQPKKPPPKDLKEIAGSFWLAASVFSKKWQKWRRKQKLKKQDGGKAAAAAMPPPEKPVRPSFLRRRRFRGDAQSDFAAGAGDAYGRRSCDTDPRFSLDAGRMSVDDAGFSWDEPRASWDGYLIGTGGGIGLGLGLGRAPPPPPLSRLPPILSVVEDSPAAAVVERSDGQIPVEDDSNADATTPGGSAQTRDYYSDSSSRRRQSLERSSSVRRPSFEVSADVKPLPANGNGKESPVGGSEFYHFHHAEDLLDRGFSSNSLVDDISASLEAAFAAPAKKPRRWRKAWGIWGFIHRKAARRRNGSTDVADRSFSEPWPEMHVRGCNAKMQRCNSNASARSSFSSNSGGLGSSRRSCIETNGHGRKRREEFVLERNRSARYSPGRLDNGMLRFYLTPMRSSGRRSGGMPGKARHVSSHSFARSMLRLY